MGVSVVPVVTDCRGETGRSHTASADRLLIKPAAGPAGTACSPGHIPREDTRYEVGQVSGHGRAGRRQPDRRSGRLAHSPSQVFHVPWRRVGLVRLPAWRLLASAWNMEDLTPVVDPGRNTNSRIESAPGKGRESGTRDCAHLLLLLWSGSSSPCRPTPTSKRSMSGTAPSSRRRSPHFETRAAPSGSAATTTAASSSLARAPRGRCASSASGECGSRACFSSGLSTSPSADSRSHRWETTRGCASAGHVTSTCTTSS